MILLACIAIFCFTREKSEIEDNSDENESENSENSSDCEEQISASNLVEALREAGKNTIRFDNISECDRLKDDFLMDAFKKVRFLFKGSVPLHRAPPELSD